ncbi:MAG: calcium-binding protein [Nocardioides sp.]
MHARLTRLGPGLSFAAVSALIVATSVTSTAAGSPPHDPVPSATPKCDGRLATIVNRHNGATVTGTSGPDVIVALGRNQTIRARAGADVVCARGSGARADGGAGNDIVRGSRFHDILAGGRGNDGIFGGRDSDDLSGGVGSDLLVGGSTGGGDWFNADPGNDTWVAGWQAGTVDPGSSDANVFDFSTSSRGVRIALRGHGSHEPGTASGVSIGHDTLIFPSRKKGTSRRRGSKGPPTTTPSSGPAATTRSSPRAGSTRSPPGAVATR